MPWDVRQLTDPPFCLSTVGDSIGKGLSAGELLNQLLLRKKNEKLALQQQQPQTPAKIIAQEVVPDVQHTSPAPTIKPVSLRPLGLSSSLKFPPRIPFPKRNEKENDSNDGNDCRMSLKDLNGMIGYSITRKKRISF